MATHGPTIGWALLTGEGHRIEVTDVIHRKEAGLLALTNKRVIFQTRDGVRRATIPVASVKGTHCCCLCFHALTCVVCTWWQSGSFGSAFPSLLRSDFFPLHELAMFLFC